MAAVIKTEFDQVVGRITQNYISDEVFVTKENRRLPSRSSIIILIKRLRSLMFPGYFEEKNFEYTDAQYFVGNTLPSWLMKVMSKRSARNISSWIVIMVSSLPYTFFAWISSFGP